MPKIIIQAESVDQSAAVTLAERVVPAEAQSEHYLAQLVERVGWALLDAEELETSESSAAEPVSTQRPRGAPSLTDQAARQATRGRRTALPRARQQPTPT